MHLLMLPPVLHILVYSILRHISTNSLPRKPSKLVVPVTCEPLTNRRFLPLAWPRLQYPIIIQHRSEVIHWICTAPQLVQLQQVNSSHITACNHAVDCIPWAPEFSPKLSRNISLMSDPCTLISTFCSLQTHHSSSELLEASNVSMEKKIENPKQPITTMVLKDILNHLQPGIKSGHAVVYTACCVAFTGLLRCGEFTAKSDTKNFSSTFQLSEASVQFLPNFSSMTQAILFLPASKTDPFCKGFSIQLAAAPRAHHLLCRSANGHSPDASKPLFPFLDDLQSWSPAVLHRHNPSCPGWSCLQPESFLRTQLSLRRCFNGSHSREFLNTKSKCLDAGIAILTSSTSNLTLLGSSSSCNASIGSTPLLPLSFPPDLWGFTHFSWLGFSPYRHPRTRYLSMPSSLIPYLNLSCSLAEDAHLPYLLEIRAMTVFSKPYPGVVPLGILLVTLLKLAECTWNLAPTHVCSLLRISGHGRHQI